jgi:hypothetical protein
VVKSLELIGSGPVVLLHTLKVGIEYKKPTCFGHDEPEALLPSLRSAVLLSTWHDIGTSRESCDSLDVDFVRGRI